MLRGAPSQSSEYVCSNLAEEANLPPHRCAVGRISRTLPCPAAFSSCSGVCRFGRYASKWGSAARALCKTYYRNGLILLFFRDGYHVRCVCLLHILILSLSINRLGSNLRAFEYPLLSQCVNNVVVLIVIPPGTTHLPSHTSLRSGAMRASRVATPGLRRRLSNSAALRYGRRSSWATVGSPMASGPRLLNKSRSSVRRQKRSVWMLVIGGEAERLGGGL